MTEPTSPGTGLKSLGRYEIRGVLGKGAMGLVYDGHDPNLDRRVATALARHGPRSATLAQKQDLAALIHLCGASAGEAYAKRNFLLADRQRCGEHDARAYLARVNAAKRLFARLSALG